MNHPTETPRGDEKHREQRAVEPRRRASERTRPPLPTVLATAPISVSIPTSAIPSDLAVEETSW